MPSLSIGPKRTDGYVCPECPWVGGDARILASYACPACVYIFNCEDGGGPENRCPQCSAVGTRIADRACPECSAPLTEEHEELLYVCPFCEDLQTSTWLQDHVTDNHAEEVVPAWLRERGYPVSS